MSSKRSLPPSNASLGEDKRQKFGQPVQSRLKTKPPNSLISCQEALIYNAEEQALQNIENMPLTRHHLARCGIQRSIAMIMSFDGFASASPEALESFTEMVETYLRSTIEEIKRLAIASRRENPISLDFEIMMKRHNIPLSSLKPHIKISGSINELAPVYSDGSPIDNNTFNSLPLLGRELSGQPDKDLKGYIPESFPSFPSTHTYKFTPQEDMRVRDSITIREEAARTAQEGEDALRRLVRASKIRKQQEVKSLVERDSQGKERFRLWESTMRQFTGSDGQGGHVHQVEIADHTMIVNGDAMFSRQDVSRLSRGAGLLSKHTNYRRSSGKASATSAGALSSSWSENN